jgi:hypothetical protein
VVGRSFGGIQDLIDDDGNLRFVSSRRDDEEGRKKKKKTDFDVGELIEHRFGIMQSGCKVSTCKPFAIRPKRMDGSPFNSDCWFNCSIPYYKW